MGLESSPQWWADAASSIQSSADALTREEAVEVYAAETARLRLADRRGHCRLELASGVSLTGELVPADVAGSIALIDERHQRIVVAPEAIRLARFDGGPALRDEVPHHLPSLRAALHASDCVRVLVGGRWLAGPLLRACADHAELRVDGESVCVAYGAAEAWVVG